LPGHIRNLADTQLDAAKALLDSPAVRRPGLLPYALIVVMSRLAAPWQLIRIATAAAKSDDAARVAATPYAPRSRSCSPRSNAWSASCRPICGAAAAWR
jgi:hypothetical protein